MTEKFINLAKDFITFLLTRSLRQVFVWLILGALGLALSVFYRNSVIYGGYADPPPLLLVPLLFEYLAFSLVALLFPWSQRVGKQSGVSITISIVATGLVFVLGYILILSFLEWYGSQVSYDFWKGYTFTLKHSFLWTVIIYALISMAVFFVIRPKRHEVDKTFLRQIAYKSNGETLLIELDRVQYFEASGNYLIVHTDDLRQLIIRKTVQNLLNALNPQQFIRIHRRYIINMTKVSSFKSEKNGGCTVFLKNDRALKVSRTYRARFLAKLAS